MDVQVASWAFHIFIVLKGVEGSLSEARVMDKVEALSGLEHVHMLILLEFLTAVFAEVWQARLVYVGSLAFTVTGESDKIHE